MRLPARRHRSPLAFAPAVHCESLLRIAMQVSASELANLQLNESARHNPGVCARQSARWWQGVVRVGRVAGGARGGPVESLSETVCHTQPATPTHAGDPWRAHQQKQEVRRSISRQWIIWPLQSLCADLINNKLPSRMHGLLRCCSLMLSEHTKSRLEGVCTRTPGLPVIRVLR